MLLIAGVDEAGRGPLAGAVYAAAVILDELQPISGLKDSKKLTALQRERLAAQIREQAKAWSIARAEVEEIDHLNILQASMLAMQRAVLALAITPELVQVDGNRCPVLPASMQTQAIIRGDSTVTEISAASILAKVARDAEMQQMHALYPAYGFDQHKGYGTVAHMAALQQHGPTPIHRRSFAPVRKLLA